MRKLAVVIASVILMIIVIPMASSLLTSLKINSGASQVTSDQQLICSWTLNESLNANVTWYRNAIQNITQNNIPCLASQQCSTGGNGIVPVSFIKRGDTWSCSVNYFNDTAVETDNVSVSITNSPPTPPRVYWQNGTETTNVTASFPQDSTTTFNVVSSDADNDTITYTLDDTSFCNIGASSGVLACSPTLISSNGYRLLLIGAEDYQYRVRIPLAVNVTPTNGPPYFSPSLTDKTVTEGQALNYIVSAADRENDWPYNFSMTTNLSSLIIEYVSNTSARIRFNNSGADIAAYADRGNYSVIVTVQDSDPTNPKSATSSFLLQVIPVNHPPSLSYIVYNNNSLSQGGNLSIYLYATDIDNDTLIFSSSDTTRYPITYNSSTDKTNVSGISSAFAWINITGLTNDYVVHHNVTLTVFDTKQNTVQTLNLNITNVNDAPVIYEKSFVASNTLNNINMSNLTAYTGVPFRYTVNATDIDMLTYQGDVLTYYSNDSNFQINSTTGRISVTPISAGSYSVNITVTDLSNASASMIANINVFPNQNPYFTQSPIIINCREYDNVNYPNDCIYNISSNSTDPDLDDYVASFWTDSTLFTINSADGMIDFRPSQDMIGNYTITLNITDSRGGTNSTTINLNIGNTNNPPNITSINTPNGRLVVGNSYQISVSALDLDLLLNNSYESLTFNVSPTGPNISMFSISKISSTQAVISFNVVSSSDAGNYSLNISVHDSLMNFTSQSVNIFIYNITNPPTIINITPFGTPFVDGSVNVSWMNASLFPALSTGISISENSTYTFDQNSIADSTYQNSLTYSWYYDDTLVSNQKQYTRYFNFFSQGTHTLQFVASDSFGYNASFNWTIDVANVDRRPLLINPPDNIVVNETTRITDYMVYANGQTKFYDPDDDPNNNGFTTGNQTTLTFSATTCPYANFSFSNGDIRVKTIALGECMENFTAYDALDPSMIASAYEVLINITGVSNDSITTEVPVPVSSSGGGGSSTQTITIPLPIEVEKPHPLQIITPELVTIYANATVKVPILLNNTWNDTLSGITLRAYTNATNVTVYLDKEYFAKLDTGETDTATLLISNYKSEGHYEIAIEANVTDPSYNDIATIFVNSAEMQSEGDQLQSKITFARDLMSSNPECQELNELLIQAQTELSNNNFAATSKLVDDVINGCKYLVSNKSPFVQQPKEFIKTFVWQSQYTDYTVVGVFGLLFVIALYYLFRKEKQEF